MCIKMKNKQNLNERENLKALQCDKQNGYIISIQSNKMMVIYSQQDPKVVDKMFLNPVIILEYSKS